jgi:hypothetical protein
MPMVNTQGMTVTSACGPSTEIRTAVRVSSVITAEGQAVGVALEDGAEIRAPVAVSALDARRTFLDLVDPRELPSELVVVLRAVREVRAARQRLGQRVRKLRQQGPAVLESHSRLRRPGAATPGGHPRSDRASHRVWPRPTSSPASSSPRRCTSAGAPRLEPVPHSHRRQLPVRIRHSPLRLPHRSPPSCLTRWDGGRRSSCPRRSPIHFSLLHRSASSFSLTIHGGNVRTRQRPTSLRKRTAAA